MKKYVFYTTNIELQEEIKKLESNKNRYKAMGKAISSLGKFLETIPISRESNPLDYFLNPLYVIDSNGTKIYFTNEKEETEKAKWLDKLCPHHVMAKEESENQYSLYTTMDGTPTKVADVYMTGDSFLYVHNNMVYQYYDFIKGTTKLRIRTLRCERLEEENKQKFLEEIKTKQPNNILEYLNLLYNVCELENYEEIEATTSKENKITETISMKLGILDKLSLENIPSCFKSVLEEPAEIRLIDEIDMNQLDKKEGFQIIYNIVKNNRDSYSLYRDFNGKNQKYGDFYVIGNQIFSICINQNQKTYSLINGEEEIEMKILASEENVNDDLALLEEIKYQQPTNIIEFLKAAAESNVLEHNPNFFAKSKVGKNTTARIAMKNYDLIEYQIPLEVYEQTKETVEYGEPIGTQYKEDPTAFQFTKKRSP